MAKNQFDPEALRELMNSNSAVDALDALGYRNQYIRLPLTPLNRETRIVGYAFTVQACVLHEGDDTSAMIPQIRTVDMLPKDSVYVLTGEDEPFPCAMFGENMATAAAARGCAGAVINGPVRDSLPISRMEFGMVCRGVSPASSKGRAGIRAVQQPVRMAGVTICPGDLIVADADGVVVVPAGILDRVAARCAVVNRDEEFVHGLVKDGVPMAEAVRRLAETRPDGE